MNCPNCQEKVPDSARHCPACEHDVGFPNVRVAESAEEQNALSSRLDNARVSTKARNCHDVLEDFGNAVLQSKAVICRTIGLVQTLASDENQLYPSFYQQVRGQARLPEDNKWDRGRPSVDGTLFPHYHEEIRCAALSIDHRGLWSTYGQCAMILKEPMICHRATVFEENPFLFCERHKVVAGTRPPPGFRALWIERNKLAMAKLHSRLKPDTHRDEYSTIIMEEGGNGNDDFIEVHIYGSINRSAIERVIVPATKKRADLVIVKSLRKKLRDINIPLEVL